MSTLESLINTGNAALSKTVYKGVSAGRQMDILLYVTALREYGHRIPGCRVLDIGVGRADNTYEYLKAGPSELVATDFQQETIDMAIERWKTLGRNPELVTWKLHDANHPIPPEFGKFGFVLEHSVRMHLDPENAPVALPQVVNALEPGGIFSFAVVPRSFAEEFFIPAGEKGGHPMFIPLASGMKIGTTFEDIPPELRDGLHRECYPPNEFYDQCFDIPGVKCRRVQAVLGEEFRGTVYEHLIGKGVVVWEFWIVELEK